MLRRSALKYLLSKRFRIIRWAAVALFSILIIGLAMFVFMCPGCSTDFTNQASNFQFSLANYPLSLASLKTKYFGHVGAARYLDYTGAGVYSDKLIDEYRDSLISRFIPSDHSLNSSERSPSEISEKVRMDLLNFLSADPSKYSVIFVASATQALKLVGENFPWTPSSKYIYTNYNHNSVLGIRRYALRANASFSPSLWPLTEESISSLPEVSAPSLFAFPLEDNFAGTKVPSNILKQITSDEGPRSRGWFIFGDAAAYLPTNPLNLTEYPLDAVSLSFYKIFGFPNTGALVIKNTLAKLLIKGYFGPGSVEAAAPSMRQFRLHKYLPFSLEDDSVPIELNIAASLGIKAMSSVGMKKVQSHVWILTRRLYEAMDKLTHSTGTKAVEIYGNHGQNNSETQGGIVAFNMKRTNGSYVGYAAVVGEASQGGFHLRGGCHCNPGACFSNMKLSEEKVRGYFAAKLTCGDNNDIVEGIPLGSVRASLGWASTEEDVDAFIEWLKGTFVF